MSVLPKAPAAGQRPFRMIKGVSRVTDLLEGGSLVNLVSKEFNIDNGSGTTDDDLLLVPASQILIASAYVMYTEATDTAGAASATVQVGTTAGGVDIVAATALEVSKAIGAKTALTIASGVVEAGEFVFVRHTGIATTEVGKYKVVLVLG